MRVPISLHYEHGLTFEEASSVLGIPAGTLRVQACRGLDELRARLGVSGRPATAEIIIAALAAGFCFRATPAVAASVESIVATGGNAAAHAPAAGMKVFLSSGSKPAAGGISLALKLIGPAAVFCVGALLAVFGFYFLGKSPTPPAVVKQIPVLNVKPNDDSRADLDSAKFRTRQKTRCGKRCVRSAPRCSGSTKNGRLHLAASHRSSVEWCGQFTHTCRSRPRRCRWAMADAGWRALRSTVQIFAYFAPLLSPRRIRLPRRFHAPRPASAKWTRFFR